MLSNEEIDAVVEAVCVRLFKTYNKLATGSIRSFIKHDQANWRRNDLGKITTAKTLASLKRLEKAGKIECAGKAHEPKWRDASAAQLAELSWRAKRD